MEYGMRQSVFLTFAERLELPEYRFMFKDLPVVDSIKPLVELLATGLLTRPNDTSVFPNAVEGEDLSTFSTSEIAKTLNDIYMDYFTLKDATKNPLVGVLMIVPLVLDTSLLTHSKIGDPYKSMVVVTDTVRMFPRHDLGDAYKQTLEKDVSSEFELNLRAFITREIFGMFIGLDWNSVTHLEIKRSLVPKICNHFNIDKVIGSVSSVTDEAIPYALYFAAKRLINVLPQHFLGSTAIQRTYEFKISESSLIRMKNASSRRRK